MNKIFTVSFIAVAVLSIAGCQNDGKAKNAETVVQEAHSTEPAVIAGDSIALTKLVRELYKWYESNGTRTADFDPKMDSGDTLFRAIDWNLHNKRVKMLTETRFFDKQFFDNYQQIAQYLDTALKSGRERWRHDELPSFGYDGNPWCNCQDSPFENYWDSIKVANLKIENNHAEFAWTWGEGSKYKVKAVKDNGAWKISYLDGFNRENWRSNP